MPLLSNALPQYSGPHAVGTIDLEVPCEPRIINPIKLKWNDKPAFALETVLFSLFYPAQTGAKSTRPLHAWIPKPISQTAQGYAKIARIGSSVADAAFGFGLWMLAGSTTVPALVDVPISALATETVIENLDGRRDKVAGQHGEGAKLPVIVFSHGMASARTHYSHYCGELASRGYVVAAIEHRDGSCPASVVMARPGTDRVAYHMSLGDLDTGDDDSFGTPELKQAQLDFRQAEVEETIRVLQQINAGDGAEVAAANPRKEGDTLADWTGMLDVNAITIAGHSYGATLALQTLRHGPTETLPISGGIILDPGKHSGPLNDDISVPVMVIHSDSWSSRHSIFFGRPHFDVVYDLVHKAKDSGVCAWFMTSMGTSHPSVTDAPLIEPTLLSWTTQSTLDVYEAVGEYVRSTDEFVTFCRTGKKTGLLAQPVSHIAYNKSKDKCKHDETQGLEPKYSKNWQVHIAS